MENKIADKIQAPLSFVERYYINDLAERDTPESKWVAQWLKEIKGKSVLSWGCGPNLYDDTLLFGELPDELVGVDVNESNIAFLQKSKHSEVLRCKNTLANHGTKISLVWEDARNKKKEYVGHFDTVCAIGMLGNFREEDFEQLLTLAFLYLKPNGRLVEVEWTDCRLSDEKYRERESYEWYSKQGLGVKRKRIKELMQKNGFKVVKYEMYNVAHPAAYEWGKIYGYVAEKI